jgi:tripartite-type tricarboxylate transporter receptor subunit TctC
MQYRIHRPSPGSATRGLSTALIALSTLAACGLAAAQPAAPWPVKPLRIIVPFGPGGASDFVARVLQPRFGELLGQQVLVDNRPGAAGNIAVELASRSSPDGYTMLLGNAGAVAINPSVFPKFPVRPLRDLACVTLIADLPGALAIHPSLPAATLREFIDHVRARPGQLNYGSAGTASPQRLAFEFVIAKTGMNIVHVPYRGGAGAATAALLGNEVSAVPATVASFIAHAKVGKLRVLAVMAPRRSAQLPEVPTMIELGFPELTTGSWQSIQVPAGTPPGTVRQLFSVIQRAMTDPVTVERLTAGGADLLLSASPEECTAFVKKQTDFWAALVQRIGVTGD